MSRPFAKYPAAPAFANFQERICASDYIATKKSKYIACASSICYKNKNIKNLEKKQSLFSYLNNIDKTQLYINLLTKLDLSERDFPVISYLDTGISPVDIDTNATPYLTYNIDPSGNLFGNTPCGINNYESYIVYNPNTET